MGEKSKTTSRETAMFGKDHCKLCLCQICSIIKLYYKWFLQRKWFLSNNALRFFLINGTSGRIVKNFIGFYIIYVQNKHCKCFSRSLYQNNSPGKIFIVSDWKNRWKKKLNCDKNELPLRLFNIAQMNCSYLASIILKLQTCQFVL